MKLRNYSHKTVKSHQSCIRLYHSTVAPEPERVIATLKRFEPAEVHIVYEAGPTGYFPEESKSSAR